MSQRPWRDHKSKDFGSDANALRRLAETIQREDGYNDETMHLMFRCAEKIEKERTARLAAEVRLAENHINHASCHECPCKLNFNKYKARAIAAEARVGELEKVVRRLAGMGETECAACGICRDVATEALRGREGK
jgi:hypothetical protein